MVRCLLVSISLVVFVGGCGGSQTAEPATTPAPPIVLGVDSDSPLEARLGISSDPVRRQYQLRESQARANAELVACMRAEGFFYAPPAVTIPRPVGIHVGPDSRAAVEEFGFGITAGFIDAIVSDPATSVTDPAETNLGYVASLTPDQADAYDLALVGPGATAADTASPGYRPAGCWGDAFGAIFERLRLLDRFDEELAALNERLAADPRVRAFDEPWSECMAEVGYSYPNETALIDDLYARLLELELREIEGSTRFASAEAVESLQAFEIDAAVAGHTCRLDFDDEVTRLRHDYESEFLDDNRFRLAELLDS